MIGFESFELIPPGKTDTVATDVVCAFRPGRLIVPQSIAPFFRITSIRFMRTEFLQDKPVPAEVFSWHACDSCGAEEASGGGKIDWGDFEISAGLQIQIGVENRSNQAMKFCAALETIEIGSMNPHRNAIRRALANVELVHVIDRAAEMLESKEACWPDTARRAAFLLRSVLPELPKKRRS